MTFSDDDLKRLKEHIPTCECIIMREELQSLIFRLEEAENCLHHVVSDKPRGDCMCLDEWRKAAGI